MKKNRLAILIFICAFALVAVGATAQKFYYGAKFKEITAPGTPESGYGHVYVADNSGTMTLYFKDDAGTATNLLASLSNNTLDQAYDQGGAGSGRTINATDGAVVIANTDADTTDILQLNKSPSGSAAGDALDITVGANGTGNAIDITNGGSGKDIDGTASTWSVTKAGVASFASVTATTIYNPAVSAAASGNTNLTVDAAGTGTIAIGGTSTGAVSINPALKLNGNVDIGDAGTDTLTIASVIDGDITLYDGTTDSPSMIFKDATAETAAFVKTDSGTLGLTTVAADGLKILVGNLWVGDGSPGAAAMNGEDFYVNGDSEFDGAVQFDGAATFASTVGLQGDTTATLGAAEYLKLDAASTAHTDTAGALDINFGSKTNGASAVNIYNNLLTGGGGAEIVSALTIDLDDDSNAAGEVVGLNIAASDVTGSSAVTGIKLANSLETGLSVAVGAANKAMVIDAESAVQTNAAGTIDAAFSTVTNGASFLNIDMVVGDAGAGVTAHGILIDLDDDTDSNAANIHGVSVISTDLTGEADTLVRAFYAKGVDVAFQADNGYLRIGTGATEDIELGDDDAFIEGTLEVDGEARFDGQLSINGAVVGAGTNTAIGLLKAVDDDTDGKTLGQITAAMSGTVLTNAAASGDAIWNLPAAAAGLHFTFAVMAAHALNINPADGDQILVLTNAAGDSIQSSTVGHNVSLIAMDGTNWIAQYTGTWTDED